MRRAILPATLLALLVAMLLLVGSALLRPTDATLNSGAARLAQVDTSAYPEITLYVAVDDPTGAPLTGLNSTDFTVLEDGVPVEVSSFGGAGSGPIASVLVLDRSGSMEDDNRIEGARTAASAFVAMLRPGDQAALLAFNDRVPSQQIFTGDAFELRRAIDRLRPDGGTALYDAIAEGVDLLQTQPGRRLLIVLSDGQDCREPTNSCPADMGSARSLDEAIAVAQAADQPVIVIGLGAQATLLNEGIDETILQQIATSTGGTYVYAPRSADLTRLYTELAGDAQSEYRLTYNSPRPFYDGTRRDLTVQVGADQAISSYTERHLINVVANPLVGLILLTPLAALLIYPSLRSRRRPRPIDLNAPNAEPEATLPPLAAADPGAYAPSAAGYATVPITSRPAAPDVAPSAPRRCSHCDTALRPDARFCVACGKVQPESVPVRRSFCDMCGRPLVPDAKFCMECGEPVNALL